MALVLAGRPHPPASLTDMKIIEGVPQALQMLHDAGFILIVVTNQPDVARGAQTRSAVDEMHADLLRRFPLDAIRVCFHDNTDNCLCRKPLPGLLLEHSGEVDFSQSFMVGDRWRDIEAGKAAGCRTIFIDYNYLEKQPTSFDFKTDSLTHAAEWICAQITGVSNEH